MYAVITTGGKQYRVSKGDIIRVEKLEAGSDGRVVFDKVLLFCDESTLDVGTPYLASCQVSAEVVSQGRGSKIDVLKFRRRKSCMKRQGHRQSYTELRITDISGEGTAAAEV